jgi:ATP-dependent protease ClpP protease subunit
MQLANRGQHLAARQGVPRAAGPWYRIGAADPETSRTKVYLYGEIGGWWDGIDANQFVRDLDAIGDSGIDLHINSGGGSVFDGMAIYAALKNHASDVTARVDSLAASAASFIAMAGDSIEIEKPGRMMIHDAQGLALGNAGDLRTMADLLDELSGSIAEIYADRAGGKASEWRDAMLTDNGMGRWYTAQQAVDAGLADRIVGSSETDKSGESDSTDEEAPVEDRATQLIRARARVTLRGGR